MFGSHCFNIAGSCEVKKLMKSQDQLKTFRPYRSFTSAALSAAFVEKIMICFWNF